MMYLDGWMNKHLPRRYFAGSCFVLTKRVSRVFTQHGTSILQIYVLTERKALVLTGGALIHISLSVLQQEQRRRQLPSILVIFVIRPQTVRLHRSITVMDWINTCYWKLPSLCGLETDHATVERQSALSFNSRESISGWIITSLSLYSRPCLSAPSPVSSEFLSVRSKSSQKNVSFHIYACVSTFWV